MDNNNLQVNRNQVSAVTQVSKAVEEVRVGILTAKQFPRYIDDVFNSIEQNTSRVKFAEKALYSYPRGGKQVKGPSIRMAEMLANSYGNITYGLGEIERGDGYSVVQAYCHDLETNVKKIMQFEVPHFRDGKNGTKTELKSDRDIYEMVANQGARRVRNVILAVIPADIVDTAVEYVNKTLETKFDNNIYKNSALILLQDYFKGNKEECADAVKKKFRKNPDSLTINEKIELISIVNSLENGMSSLDDWFKKEERQSLVTPIDEPTTKKIQAKL